MTKILPETNRLFLSQEPPKKSLSCWLLLLSQKQKKQNTAGRPRRSALHGTFEFDSHSWLHQRVYGFLCTVLLLMRPSRATSEPNANRCRKPTAMAPTKSKCRFTLKNGAGDGPRRGTRGGIINLLSRIRFTSQRCVRESPIRGLICYLIHRRFGFRRDGEV